MEKVELQEASPALKETVTQLDDKKRAWAFEGFQWGFLSTVQLASRSFIEKLYSIWLVAGHEIGHEAVIRSEGGFVKSVTVIPGDNYLGLTSWVPDLNQGEDAVMGQVVAASHGGEIAEGFLDQHDHSGCTSDRGKGRFFSSLLARVSGDSAGNVLSKFRSRAHQAVSDFGIQNLRHRSWLLATQGTLA